MASAPYSADEEEARRSYVTCPRSTEPEAAQGPRAGYSQNFTLCWQHRRQAAHPTGVPASGSRTGKSQTARLPAGVVFEGSKDERRHGRELC